MLYQVTIWVFFLLLSAYLRFLSEALEFPDGAFCVVPVTAFAVFNPLFAVFTWYVRLSCFCLWFCLSSLSVCCWFAWASCLRLLVLLVFSRVFVAPLCFMWVGGFSLVGSRVLGWVYWWCDVFLRVVCRLGFVSFGSLCLTVILLVCRF